MSKKDLFIGLNLVSGVGPVLSKRIADMYQSVHEVVTAKKMDFLQVKGVRDATAGVLGAFNWRDEIEKEKNRAKQNGVQILSILDEEFPPLLKEIYDPPQVLYYKGNMAQTEICKMAIVGSRVASSYGKIMAEILSGGLAKRNIATVSGFARGVDTVVHRHTIEAGGKTIAVLGSGLDIIYPPENKKMCQMLTEKGALLSEFPLGTKPDRMNFPRRNRLISGMCLGTIVIEAGKKSGSLITAEFATDQGRDVFAVPGNVTSPKSYGTNALIKNGAKLVTDVDDVINELPFDFTQEEAKERTRTNELFLNSLSLAERKVFSCLSLEEKHIDEITGETELSPGKVSGILLKMELNAVVRRASGQYYVKAPESV